MKLDYVQSPFGIRRLQSRQSLKVGGGLIDGPLGLALSALPLVAVVPTELPNPRRIGALFPTRGQERASIFDCLGQ